jgi:hypothetical protein
MVGTTLIGSTYACAASLFAADADDADDDAV